MTANIAKKVLIVGAIFLLVGCAKDQRMHVWGSVTFDGGPLPDDGMIELIPQGATRGSSTGGIIKDGEYDIPAKIGPYAGGTYQVQISARRDLGRTMPNIAQPDGPPIPVKNNYIHVGYNYQSVLSVTVSSDRDKNQFDFSLNSQGPPEQSPNSAPSKK